MTNDVSLRGGGCRICTNAQGLRELVDAALLAGDNVTDISAKFTPTYGDGVSLAQSIYRHRDRHLYNRSLTTPREHVDPLSASQIIDKLNALFRNTQRVHDDAMERGNSVIALKAGQQAQSALVELAKFKDVSRDVMNAAEAYDTLVAIVQAAIKVSPVVANAVADAAEAKGEQKMANDIRRIHQ